jgi:hypothetical protein
VTRVFIHYAFKLFFKFPWLRLVEGPWAIYGPEDVGSGYSALPFRVCWAGRARCAGAAAPAAQWEGVMDLAADRPGGSRL